MKCFASVLNFSCMLCFQPFLFEQESVSVEELSADSSQRKFVVLKTDICPRSEALRTNMLVLRTSNFEEAAIKNPS